MNPIGNIMSVIDEYKSDIPDGVYLKICKELGKRYKEEEEKNIFVELTYIYAIIEQNLDLEMSIHTDKQIVELKPREYKDMVKNWDKKIFNNIKNKLSQHKKILSVNALDECECCEDKHIKKFYVTTNTKLISYKRLN